MTASGSAEAGGGTPIEKLVSMGNQIASYFRSYPRAEACVGIREHIEAFWTPRMKRSLLDHGAHEGLDPLVAEAMRSWPRAESPIRKELAGPAAGGALASDAG